MVFRYALLALLCEGPDHGYALRDALDELLAPFWSVNQGQVYGTLYRLVAQSLITPYRDASDARQEEGPRRPHAIAPRGREALDRWMERPAVDVRRPNELLARLALLAALQRRKALRRLVAAQRRRVTRMAKDGARSDGAPERAESAERARAAALLHCAAELEWLDLVERELLGAGQEPARPRIGAEARQHREKEASEGQT